MRPNEHVEELKTPIKGGVYIEKSVTKNMGDYNSARVTIGVTVPLDADEDFRADVKVAIRRGVRLVDEAIEKEVNQLLD